MYTRQRERCPPVYGTASPKGNNAELKHHGLGAVRSGMARLASSWAASRSDYSIKAMVWDNAYVW